MAFNRFNPPPKKRTDKDSSGFGTYVEAEKLTQIAIVLPVAVTIGWVVGWWADGRFHQSWIEVAGAVFGCIAGLSYMIREALGAKKEVSLPDATRNGNNKNESSDNS